MSATLTEALDRLLATEDRPDLGKWWDTVPDGAVLAGRDTGRGFAWFDHPTRRLRYVVDLYEDTVVARHRLTPETPSTVCD